VSAAGSIPDNASMGATGTRAIDAARRAGVPFSVRSYPHDERAGLQVGGSGYALEAAEALAVDPARVFKTLVASVDDGLVVAVVPANAQLDLKALAVTVGGRRAVLADPSAAQRATGYVLGGISPIGQKRRLPSVVDASALGHDTVLVSAGRRGLEIELAPTDLVRLIDARVAAIARG
jgi:Cys-tRNA(Pro)/Cys-tRNA(Cys) deacylase